MYTSALADNISHNSSSAFSTDAFASVRKKAEKQTIKCSFDNAEVYNRPFSFEELQDALRRAHDTSGGPNEIHYRGPSRDAPAGGGVPGLPVCRRCCRRRRHAGEYGRPFFFFFHTLLCDLTQNALRLCHRPFFFNQNIFLRLASASF